jgi:ADP-heptose:LPS heptosyltransferase
MGKGDCFAVIALHFGMGDVCMALPVLKALGAMAPENGRVVVLVKSSREAGLIRLFGFHTRFDFINVRENPWSPAVLALRLLRLRPRYFIAPDATDRSAVLARLLRPTHSIGSDSAAGRKYFSTVVERRRGEHKADYWIRLLNEFGPCRPAAEIWLELREELNGKLAIPSLSHWAAAAPRLVISPGSGYLERHKRWPATHIAAFMDTFLGQYKTGTVLIVGASPDGNAVSQLRDLIDEKRVLLAMDRPLQEVLGLLRHCHCVVSACSGLSHLGALVGARIVGVFGPTNPGFTGPFTPDLWLVRAGMSCSPCYRPGFNQGCGRALCMSGVSPEQVMAAVESALKGDSPTGRTWWETTAAAAPAW